MKTCIFETITLGCWAITIICIVLSFLYRLVCRKARNRYRFLQTTATVVAVCLILSGLAVIYHSEKEIPLELVSIIMSLAIAALSFILNREINASTHLETFKYELKDIKRHLLENAKVLNSIAGKLSDSKSLKPIRTHLDNLMIPENITLFSCSDKASIRIMEKYNLMRIRLQLRNINNSAKFMAEYVDNNSNYSPNEFRKINDWEILRYYKRILAFEYLELNSMIEYPDSESLETYIRNLDDDNSTFAKILDIHNDLNSNISAEELKQIITKKDKPTIFINN